MSQRFIECPRNVVWALWRTSSAHSISVDFDVIKCHHKPRYQDENRAREKQEERETQTWHDVKNGKPLVHKDFKIAKVRVAGSNPVIRSMKPPFGAVFRFCSKTQSEETLCWPNNEFLDVQFNWLGNYVFDCPCYMYFIAHSFGHHSLDLGKLFARQSSLGVE